MEKLKQKLIQAVNESGLSLEAIYYVSKDFFRDVDDTYKDFLSKMREESLNNTIEKEKENE